jgi:hypothetical protein
MLTLLDRIQEKLPQASESVLEQVWTILTSTDGDVELSALEIEDEELDAEFALWDAASDEDEAQIEHMLTTQPDR